MALLLGVLIGLGRLSADSELTALGACGVGPTALYTPVLGAAAALSLLVLFVYNAVLPATNEELERSMARVAASSIVNVVAPRTFREPRPGITFFFDRVAADGAILRGHLPEARRRGRGAQPGHRRAARRAHPRGRPALARPLRVHGARGRSAGPLPVPDHPERLAAPAPCRRIAQRPGDPRDDRERDPGPDPAASCSPRPGGCPTPTRAAGRPSSRSTRSSRSPSRASPSRSSGFPWRSPCAAPGAAAASRSRSPSSSATTSSCRPEKPGPPTAGCRRPWRCGFRT